MRCTWFSYLVWAADSHHKWGALGSAIWFELLIHTTNEAHLVSYLVWAADSHHKWGALGSAIWFELLIHTTNEAHLVQLFGLSCWFTPQMRRTWFSYLVWAADSHHKWGALGSAIWFELLIHSTSEALRVLLFGWSCWFTPQMRCTWFSYLVWAADSYHKWGALGSAIWFWAADSHHKWGALGLAI